MTEYYTETIRVASQIITNPWFVLIGAGVIGIFMLLMVFILVPSIFTREYLKKH